MSESRFCDKCIFILVQLLSKEEILLLNLLKKNNIINPQLSLNEKELLDLIDKNFGKEITMYSLRKMIYRLTANNFLIGQKFNSTKFYISINGLRALQIYNAYVSRQFKANKEDTSKEIEKESSNTTVEKKNTIKRKTRKKGE